jgi:hypothetical protein
MAKNLLIYALIRPKNGTPINNIPSLSVKYYHYHKWPDMNIQKYLSMMIL